MNENTELELRKLADLARRAYARGCWEYSNFLDAAQQGMLLAAARDMDAPFELFGGHSRCERKIAVFGSEELCGYPAQPPIACVEIAPKSGVFAQELTHRDYLGALMALGIRREAVGDIFVTGGADGGEEERNRQGGSSAYVFCLENIAPYIVENLSQAARTTVVCSLTDDPPIPEQRFETRRVNVASERLDAVLGAVWRLSRGAAADLIKAERVMINARVCDSPSHILRAGDTVSARGFGKFLYKGESGRSKKDRLFVEAEVYA